MAQFRFRLYKYPHIEEEVWWLPGSSMHIHGILSLYDFWHPPSLIRKTFKALGGLREPSWCCRGYQVYAISRTIS